MNRLQVARITKGIIDFMFYAGILVCLTLPISLRYLGTYFRRFFSLPSSHPDLLQLTYAAPFRLIWSDHFPACR